MEIVAENKEKALIDFSATTSIDLTDDMLPDISTIPPNATAGEVVVAFWKGLGWDEEQIIEPTNFRISHKSWAAWLERCVDAAFYHGVRIVAGGFLWIDKGPNIIKEQD